MAFRKKSQSILKYKPDILIVAECENEQKLKFGKSTPVPNDFVWCGTNPNKGLGVFSYSNYKLDRFKRQTSKFRHILPLKVSGKDSFSLFAVWAQNAPNDQAYIGQVAGAVKYYSAQMGMNSFVVGDFNWNKIWDDPRCSPNTLIDTATLLKRKNITSAYHSFFKEEFGGESRPTLFLQRNGRKHYHIDYCFAPYAWIRRLKRVQVGKFQKWTQYSDHCPLIVDFAFSRA